MTRNSPSIGVNDLGFRARVARSRAVNLAEQSRKAFTLVLHADLEGVATADVLASARSASGDLDREARAAEEEAGKLEGEAAVALNHYLAAWKPGMPAPFGLQECRHKNGSHLRRVVAFRPRHEVRLDRPTRPEISEPVVELADGEEALYTIGDPRPVIVERPYSDYDAGPEFGIWDGRWPR
jgi:hypothetical protein